MRSQLCAGTSRLTILYVPWLLISSLIYVVDLLQGRYRKWAVDVKFESKLPGDVKKRKEAADQVTHTLDRDLKEKKVTERVVAYSDRIFRQVVIEWLVATDQVGSPSSPWQTY
jgi:hypothetical protein